MYFTVNKVNLQKVGVPARYTHVIVVKKLGF